MDNSYKLQDAVAREVRMVLEGACENGTWYISLEQSDRVCAIMRKDDNPTQLSLAGNSFLLAVSGVYSDEELATMSGDDSDTFRDIFEVTITYQGRV